MMTTGMNFSVRLSKRRISLFYQNRRRILRQHIIAERIIDLAPRGAEIANKNVNYIDKRDAEATSMIFLKAYVAKL